MGRPTIFFETLFPAAGSWERLKEIRRLDQSDKAPTVDKNGNGVDIPATSCFSTKEVEHFNKMFELLGDDEAAKASLAQVLQYTQMKDDLSGF